MIEAEPRRVRRQARAEGRGDGDTDRAVVLVIVVVVVVMVGGVTASGSGVIVVSAGMFAGTVARAGTVIVMVMAAVAVGEVGEVGRGGRSGEVVIVVVPQGGDRDREHGRDDGVDGRQSGSALRDHLGIESKQPERVCKEVRRETSAGSRPGAGFSDGAGWGDFIDKFGRWVVKYLDNLAKYVGKTGGG